MDRLILTCSRAILGAYLTAERLPTEVLERASQGDKFQDVFQRVDDDTLMADGGTPPRYAD